MRIFAQAPTRLSLFGGGTDLPSYTKDHVGIVINIAINLRSKVTLYTGEDLFYAENQFPINAKPELFYAIFKAFDIGSMHHVAFLSRADAFLGAGLGTSGSSAVTLISAINKALSLGLDKNQMAEKAFEIESSIWNTGRQDVYAAAFGGMNIFYFGKRTEIETVPRLFAENIKKNLFLFYIGGERKPQVKTLSNLTDIKALAKDATINLSSPEAIGRLLDTAWQLKKKSNPNVSNGKIDNLYNIAIQAGAWGGKVCGAGGAGYMIFMAADKKSLIKALSKEGIEEVDYEIDWQGVEARIL